MIRDLLSIASSIASALGLALLVAPAFAQNAPPGTDIFLIDLESPDSPAINITARAGYDNQPSFSPDDSIIYYTRSDESGQTDIWSYALATGEHHPVSLSPTTSEYSPTPVPDTAALSVVRVEEDGVQRLWQLSLDGGEDELLIPEQEPVGYHAWFSPRSVALFLLPEPFQLKLYANEAEQLDVATAIGRALAVHPMSKELLYVDKSGTTWQITGFAPGAEPRVLAGTFPGQEDFAVGASGALWMGYQSKLYTLSDGAETWRLARNMAADGMSGISRLAISNNERWIAVVAEEPAENSSE